MVTVWALRGRQASGAPAALQGDGVGASGHRGAASTGTVTNDAVFESKLLVQMSRVKATESLPWQRLVRCVSGPAAGGAEQQCQLRGAREVPIAAACCLRDADGNKLLSVNAGNASGFYRPRVRKKGEKKKKDALS